MDFEEGVFEFENWNFVNIRNDNLASGRAMGDIAECRYEGAGLALLKEDPEFTSTELLTRKDRSAEFPVYGLSDDKTRNKQTIWGLTATINPVCLY